jgi:hypothetical protein
MLGFIWGSKKGWEAYLKNKLPTPETKSLENEESPNRKYKYLIVTKLIIARLIDNVNQFITFSAFI